MKQHISLRPSQGNASEPASEPAMAAIQKGLPATVSRTSRPLCTARNEGAGGRSKSDVRMFRAALREAELASWQASGGDYLASLSGRRAKICPRTSGAMMAGAAGAAAGCILRLLVLLMAWQPVPAIHAEEAGLRSGEPAPALELQHLWNAPEGFRPTWEALRGQVVVLDFWAMWCGPCVKSIPDMNQLVEECRDLPVKFLAITDESPETTRAFLSRTPMSAIIGIDTNGLTLKRFGVETRPHAVVVAADGRVAAVTRPYALTRDFLQAVIANRTEQLYEPLAQFTLRRHVGVSKSSSLTQIPGGVRLRNVSLLTLINNAVPQCQSRVELRTPLPPDIFDIEVAAPGAAELRWQPLLRSSLESTFGLHLREEVRDTEVLLLTRPSGRTIKVGEPGAEDRVSSSPGAFVATSTTLASFASHLGLRLAKPVLDETGMTNRVRIELAWDPSAKVALAKVVQDQLGLELVPARRRLVHLVVEESTLSAR